MKVIVFSKDRALQLDAFLRSYQAHVAPLGRVHVLYLTSSQRHAEAYQAMFEQYHFAVPVRQTASFRDDVLNLLQGDEQHVVFFVDDQIFTQPWAVCERQGLSLRLGLNLTYNYLSHSAPQPLPRFEDWSEDIVTWRWAEGVLAWGYPLSVDGHMFDLAEFRSMVEQTSFHSPNTLEAHLQQFVFRFAERWGLCYRTSKVVNVPWNLVQTDWYTRYSADGNDAETMLRHWENGQRIDMNGLYGVLNESVHQEFPLALEGR